MEGFHFGAQPWVYPQPVLIIASYGENSTPDAMNAAWGGVTDSSRIAMYLSGGHKTVKNIKSITQLPLTGAAGTMLFTVVALLVAGAGVTIAIKSRQNAEA